MFNEDTHNNEYVGLQYTSGQAHGTGTNSGILGTSTSTDTTTLYGWYNSKIKPSYSSIIDTNAGFCSDRDPYTDKNGTTLGGGTGTTTTYYGAYIRYVKGGSYQTSYTPVLTCKNASDRLKLPVGLITADEYALAGGGGGSSNANTTFWLHTGQGYWTMTPYNLEPDYYNYAPTAVLFVVDEDGYIRYYALINKFDVRPVINLKSSTIFEDNGADGTSSKPYVVKVS